MVLRHRQTLNGLPMGLTGPSKPSSCRVYHCMWKAYTLQHEKVKLYLWKYCGIGVILPSVRTGLDSQPLSHVSALASALSETNDFPLLSQSLFPVSNHLKVEKKSSNLSINSGSCDVLFLSR